MLRRSGASVALGPRCAPGDRISPASGSRKPAISRNVVVLPHPRYPQADQLAL